MPKTRSTETISYSDPESAGKKGGWRRILLLCLLPVYALIGWLRLSEALRFREYLVELNIWPRPLYFAVTGAVLGAAFTLAWFFLLIKFKWSGRFNRLLGFVFLFWFWIDRIWFSLREAFFNQLFVAFLVTAITLGWMFLLIQRTDLHRKEAHNGTQTGTGS